MTNEDLWKPEICTRLDEETSKDQSLPTTPEDFFYHVQEQTGFFKTQDNQHYCIHPKQLDWLKLFDRSLPCRRALLGSRGKGKSEIITILGSAWTIYTDPTVKIGVMSFKFDHADKLVRQILEILSSVGIELIHRAGGWYSKQASGHTPTLMPLGLASTVRMLHFHYLIMDDPLTVNQQFSKKFIDRSRFFINEGSSISDHIILIGQLLTRNDLYYDAFSCSTGEYYLMQSWHGDIPELDKDIEYLRRTIGTKDLSRNYLGYIDDKQEAIFSGIQFYSEQMKSPVYAFIDPSSKGQDFTAVCVCSYQDGRIIIHGKLFHKPWGACLKDIIEYTTGCKIVYYEDNQGVALGMFLRKGGVPAQGVTSTANKIAKIYSLRNLVISDRIRLHNSMDNEAIDQIKTWTETAEYDDMPDCMAMLVQKMGWVYGY